MGITPTTAVISLLEEGAFSIEKGPCQFDKLTWALLFLLTPTTAVSFGKTYLLIAKTYYVYQKLTTQNSPLTTFKNAGPPPCPPR
jgi:hypothetical protein